MYGSLSKVAYWHVAHRSGDFTTAGLCLVVSFGVVRIDRRAVLKYLSQLRLSSWLRTILDSV